MREAPRQGSAREASRPRETAAEGLLEHARGARFDRTEAANDVEVLRTVVMSAEREDMGAIQNLDTSLAGE